MKKLIYDIVNGVSLFCIRNREKLSLPLSLIYFYRLHAVKFYLLRG